MTLLTAVALGDGRCRLSVAYLRTGTCLLMAGEELKPLTASFEERTANWTGVNSAYG